MPTPVTTPADACAVDCARRRGAAAWRLKACSTMAQATGGTAPSVACGAPRGTLPASAAANESSGAPEVRDAAGLFE